jgi:hypothetical protein
MQGQKVTFQGFNILGGVHCEGAQRLKQSPRIKYSPGFRGLLRREEHPFRTCACGPVQAMTPRFYQAKLLKPWVAFPARGGYNS